MVKPTEIAFLCFFQRQAHGPTHCNYRTIYYNRCCPVTPRIQLCITPVLRDAYGGKTCRNHEASCIFFWRWLLPIPEHLPAKTQAYLVGKMVGCQVRARNRRGEKGTYIGPCRLTVYLDDFTLYLLDRRASIYCSLILFPGGPLSIIKEHQCKTEASGRRELFITNTVNSLAPSIESIGNLEFADKVSGRGRL